MNTSKLRGQSFRRAVLVVGPRLSSLFVVFVSSCSLLFQQIFQTIRTEADGRCHGPHPTWCLVADVMAETGRLENLPHRVARLRRATLGRGWTTPSAYKTQAQLQSAGRTRTYRRTTDGRGRRSIVTAASPWTSTSRMTRHAALPHGHAAGSSGKRRSRQSVDRASGSPISHGAQPA